MINKGDMIGVYEVIAAHTQEYHGGRTQGVALGYAPHKREYGVWIVYGDDACGGRYTFDSERALLLYSERVIDMLFTYYNKMAPGVSFSVRPGESV